MLCFTAEADPRPPEPRSDSSPCSRAVSSSQRASRRGTTAEPTAVLVGDGGDGRKRADPLRGVGRLAAGGLLPGIDDAPRARLGGRRPERCVLVVECATQPRVRRGCDGKTDARCGPCWVLLACLRAASAPGRNSARFVTVSFDDIKVAC